MYKRQVIAVRLFWVSGVTEVTVNALCTLVSATVLDEIGVNVPTELVIDEPVNPTVFVAFVVPAEPVLVTAVTDMLGLADIDPIEVVLETPLIRSGRYVPRVPTEVVELTPVKETVLLEDGVSVPTEVVELTPVTAFVTPAAALAKGAAANAVKPNMAPP